jgi:triphosphatase
MAWGAPIKGAGSGRKSARRCIAFGVVCMDSPTRELELKVELAAGQWRQLLANPALEGMAAGPAQLRKLESVYYDTVDHILHRNGISLRVRRSGRKVRQTVKAETGVRGGVSNPLEVETDLDAAEPSLAAIEGPVGERVRALVGGEPVRPLFETVVERSSRLLSPPGGGSVELALDEGSIRAGDAVAAIHEAELELRAGDAATLLAVAEALLGGIEFRLGLLSKAERGYRLLRGDEDLSASPEKSIPEPVGEDQSCAEVFAATCRSATRQILHNWQVVVDSADPEGPHQLRIGLRRLRSALRAFRPAIDSDALRALGDEARQLAQRVGALRDLDVLAVEIVAPLALRGGGGDGFPALQKLLTKRSARQRARLQRDLADVRWSPLRLKLALLAHGAGWAECAGSEAASAPAASQARLAMRKAWKRVKQEALRLDELSVPERHELRKRLKMLRYAAEFFTPLFPEAETGRFLKRLRRLLDTFGYLNDVAMAETLTDLCRAEAAPDSERDAAAGYVLGWHSARAEKAWEGVPMRWRQLKQAERFWR